MKWWHSFLSTKSRQRKLRIDELKEFPCTYMLSKIIKAAYNDKISKIHFGFPNENMEFHLPSNTTPDEEKYSKEELEKIDKMVNELEESIESASELLGPNLHYNENVNIPVLGFSEQKWFTMVEFETTFFYYFIENLLSKHNSWDNKFEVPTGEFSSIEFVGYISHSKENAFILEILSITEILHEE